MTTFIVNKDVVLNKLDTTTVNKIPVCRLPLKGQPGQVLLNSVDKQFYGWNGTEWLLLSGNNSINNNSMIFLGEIVSNGTENILSFTNFSSISFSTLLFIGWGATTGKFGNIYCNFNNSDLNYLVQINRAHDSGYNSKSIYYNNYTYLPLGIIATGLVETYVGNFELMLPNWSNTNYYKCAKSVCGVGANIGARSYNDVSISTWASTEAINKVDFHCVSGSFSSGTTIRLYGI